MAKKSTRSGRDEPGFQHMIRPIVGPYRGQAIYAGADYDAAIAEGWAVDAQAAPLEAPGEDIEDIDGKLELANAMAAKWIEAGGPEIVPGKPETPEDVLDNELPEPETEAQRRGRAAEAEKPGTYKTRGRDR